VRRRIDVEFPVATGIQAVVPAVVSGCRGAVGRPVDSLIPRSAVYQLELAFA
jgi:hypothetical protein